MMQLVNLLFLITFLIYTTNASRGSERDVAGVLKALHIYADHASRDELLDEERTLIKKLRKNDVAEVLSDMNSQQHRIIFGYRKQDPWFIKKKNNWWHNLWNKHKYQLIKWGKNVWNNLKKNCWKNHMKNKWYCKIINVFKRFPGKRDMMDSSEKKMMLDYVRDIALDASNDEDSNDEDDDDDEEDEENDAEEEMIDNYRDYIVNSLNSAR